MRHFAFSTGGAAIDERSESERQSEAPEEAEPQIAALFPPSPRGIEPALRIAVPALAGLVLVAYMLGETVAIDHDLRVMSPAAVRPGDRVPVRAFLYGELNAVQGARLVGGELSARIVDVAGRRLAHAVMRAGHAGSYEGTLQLPADALGELRLQVRARIGDGETVASGALRVVPSLGPTEPLPRSLRALQQLSPGSVVAVDAAAVPQPLRTVVGGGGCVPEQPCQLWVHVGAPAAAVTVEASGAVTPLAVTGPAQGSETDAVVALPVRVHGPEAVLKLVASRAGQPVARRSVRLPILLGSGALSLRAPDAAGSGLRIALSGEPGSCIVDAYRDGRWVETVTVEACDAPTALPAPGRLSHGIWRLQARRDPFSSASAGVGVLRVPAAVEAGPADALAQLATAAHRLDRDDVLVAQVLADPARFATAVAQPDAVLGYLRAKLEQGVIPLPQPVTSYAEASRRFAARRGRAKSLTLVALVFSGLSLGLLVARRGMAASAEAREIMARAGDATARTRRRRLVMTLRVLGVMAAILLAFVVIALYVIARGISLN